MPDLEEKYPTDLSCEACGEVERVSRDRWYIDVTVQKMDPKDVIAICQACGSYQVQNGEWGTICSRCGRQKVKLHGLFVPHLCEDCLQKVVDGDIAKGNVCLLCGQPHSLCCC